MTIRVVAQLSVAAANLERFTASVVRVGDIVRRLEAGRTVVFETHSLGPDGLKFFVHEGFADLDAYTGHARNMAEHAKGVGELCTVDWAVITGELPAAMADQIRAAGGATAYYGHTLSKL